MNRIDIIQGLINKNGYKKYLEIGVRDGSCFNAIKCEVKVGVDPDPNSAANVKMTSDEFFYLLPDGVRVNPVNGTIVTAPVKYDIVFIDGLHHSDQVIKDIANSLKHLEEGGTIVMHDCFPTNEFMTIIPMRPDHNEWTGDTYKAYLHYRTTDPNLEMCVVDCDWGCGIIRPGKQDLLVIQGEITFNEFFKNRNHWMNEISEAEFVNRFL